MLTLNLPTDLERALDELAAETKMTKEAVVEEAIRRHLEDIEDIRIATERMAEIDAGRSGRISLEETKRRLGLDD